MKSLRIPKDGKTICANGHRFATMEELHKYAADRNMFVSNTEQVGVFTMCDLSSYETGTLLTESEIVDFYRPA